MKIEDYAKYVLIGCLILTLVFGFLKSLRDVSPFLLGVRVQGSVIDETTNILRRCAKQTVVVNFTTRQGDNRVFTDTMRCFGETYKIGDVVSVYYTNDLGRIEIFSVAKIILPLMFLGLIIAVSVIILVARKGW